jgi:serine/threonine protein kinase
MSDEHDSIEKLLDSMSHDRPINWDSATRDASPEDRSRIEALRQISGIASFNRTLQRRKDDPNSPRHNPNDADVPDKWGDMLVLEWIGAKATTQVYRAWEPVPGRDVALELFASGMNGPAVASLLDNGRAVTGVRHQNLISTLGVDDREGRLGVWVELRHGTTLEHKLRFGARLDPDDVARLGGEIGAALVAVHDGGILHRGIQPASVIQDSENRYLLAPIEVANDAASVRPGYRAPELFAGARESERSDLYALGLVLWFAATGRHPFDHASPGEQAQAPPLPAEVPTALARIIARAIELSPVERFESARQLVEALQAWRDSIPKVAGDPGTRGEAKGDAVGTKSGRALAWLRRHGPSGGAGT